MLNIVSAPSASGLTLRLEGRLDTATAPQLEAAWAAIRESVKELTIDCDALDYVSSAGLRVLLTIQKRMKEHVNYIQVSKDIVDIFQITGFSQLLHYTVKAREISVEGCERIAVGGNGEVFRIDGETILKLYRADVGEGAVEREKAAARAALVAGLPTAISYEIVTCQGRRGVLYEMLRAETLSQRILAEPDRLEEYVRLFAGLCKQIHGTPGDAALFPRAEEETIACIRSCGSFTPRQKDALIGKVLSKSNPGTYIHGDLHTMNIMVQNGELCLIDMGGFGIGSPWYDLAQTYLIYVELAKNGNCRRATGLEPELALRVWDLFVKDYFGPDTDREAVVRKLKPYLLYRHVVAGELRGWKEPREFMQGLLREAFPELADL